MLLKGTTQAALSGINILLAAFLLFSVQPLISKLFLPLFGGTPMVWNICALFFQVLLLAGYLAAHLVQKLPPRWEGLTYAALLIISLTALPIGLPPGWSPEEFNNFSFNLLVGLSLTVGLPYFTVASASPTIQKWFSRTLQPSANDPYFLYALSNLGSLAALLAYPLVVEPFLTLDEQLQIWSMAFMAFAAGMMMLRFLTKFTSAKHGSPQPASAPSSTSARQRLQWVLLAFVPSSLSLGVTQHLTTDVAAIPLLWILPLALYLTSFIVAFARNMSFVVAVCRAAFPLGVALPAVLLANELHHNITLQIAGHLFGLFVIATCAHSLLAEKRPPVSDLTQYYLLLSVGGALGGVFNALLAPVLFNGIWEYAIALVLAAFVAWPEIDSLALKNWKDRLLPSEQDLFLALAAVAAVITAKPALDYMGISSLAIVAAVKFGIPLIICLAAAAVQKRFIAVISLLMLFPHLGVMSSRKTIFTDRSFFGLLRVQHQPLEAGHWVQLWHGSTVHGMQHSGEDLRNEPATYFSRSSPLGRVLESDYALEVSDIAIVGLGAGTMAAYGLPHWTMTYYEIDPAVVKIASDPQYFTYLKDSAAKIEYVLGDARLKLDKRPDASLDVLIIDAFSSDAIPVHLITREAVELYMRKLRPNGVLVMHLTNRYLTLLPLAASLTSELNLSGLGCVDSEISHDEALSGKYASRWAIIARDPEIIKELQLPSYCQPLSEIPAVKTWTDSYSNILSVLN